MTTSYLDETWFEGQAGELTALQARLKEHLDVIALAAGQLPDLAGQLLRLEQRELETFKKLDMTRQSAQKELRTALGTAVAEVAGAAEELGRRLEGQRQESETGLVAATAQLQTSLQEQHGQVHRQLQDEFEVMLRALPATAQRMEQRTAELEKMLEVRLNDFQSSFREQGLQLREQGEASLQAESVRLQKLVTLQGERSLEASTTLDRERQSLEQSLLALLDETAQRFERRVAEVEARAAAHGAQAETRVAALESRLERLQNQNGQLEAEIAVARQETAQLRAGQETTGEWLDTLSQLTEQLRLAADTRLQTIEAQLPDWAQELSRVRAAQEEQVEHAQADLQAAQDRWDAQFKARTAEVTRQLDTLTQAADASRLDTDAHFESIERQILLREARWEQNVVKIHAEQRALAGQAQAELQGVQEQWSARLTARSDETEQRLGKALDQHGTWLDDLGAQLEAQGTSTAGELARLGGALETTTTGLAGAVQATGRLRADLERGNAQMVTTLQRAVDSTKQKIEQAEQAASGQFARTAERFSALELSQRETETALGGRLKTLKEAVEATDIKIDGAATRLASFMSWFNQSGAWTRLNGKPEQ